MNTALVVLVGFQTCSLLAVVGGFLLYLHRRDEREQVERRELITRITHPALVPLPARPAPRAPVAESEPDESHLVGVVQPAGMPDQPAETKP